MNVTSPLDAAFFAQLFDAAPDAVVVADSTGRIVLANSQVTTLLGWEAVDLVGRPVEVLIPFAAKRGHHGHRAKYAADPTPRPMGEGRALVALHFDGTEVPVDISLSPIRHDGETYVAASLRDATERRAIERRLSQSEERMRTSLESMLDGFALFDAVRDDGDIVDFRLTHVNAVGARTVRRPAGELVGVPLTALVRGVLGMGAIDALARVVDTGAPWAETAYDGGDGRVYEFRAWKLDDGFAVTWRDVTARESAAEALRLSEERFRGSVEHLHDALSVFTAVRDDRGAIVDFRWEFANALACRTIGRIREDLIGRTLLEVLPNHGPSGLFDTYRRVTLTGEPFIEPTLWYDETWGDGRRARRAFDVRATRLGDGFVVVSRDVTTERESVERDIRHREELEQVNAEIRRLNELGDLLQSCVAAEEAYAVGARAAAALLPGLSGGISTIDAATGVVGMSACWRDDGSLCEEGGREVFVSTDCWALRRGQPHLSAERAPRCAHLPDDVTHALCVPMVGQGDMRGALHVYGTDAGIGEQLSDSMSLATTVARQVAMAAANLRMRDQLRALSVRDPLTGLFNRRYMEETLTRELARARRAGTALAVAQLDVDLFKAYNDRHGHAAGDAILVAVAGALEDSFRASDVVCRYGGEEFTVILPECGPADAAALARRLGAAVAALEVRHRGEVLPAPTISCGIAAFPGDAPDSEGLVAKADGALYAGKAAGRNAVVRAEEAFAVRPVTEGS